MGSELPATFRDHSRRLIQPQTQGIAPTHEVLDAAHAIVRALTPGDGRTNRVESEDELRHRLAEDGLKVGRKQFAAALEVLDVNGEAGGFDTGALSGLPYRIVRPESRLPRTLLNPNPSRPMGAGGFAPVLSTSSWAKPNGAPSRSRRRRPSRTCNRPHGLR
jgi:hypothetical protein